MGYPKLAARIITITPNAASFATPYSSADVIGGVNTVTDAVLDEKGCAKLTSIVVIDKTNQKSALDLVFFNETPGTTIGADNEPYVLVDDDASKLLGRVSIAGASYVSSSSTNAEATLMEKDLGLLLQAIANSRNVYMAVVSRGTPTYGAATDLVIKLGLSQ